MDVYVYVSLLLTGVMATHAAMDLPKFGQLVLLYPGYYLHGGRYRDDQVLDMVGGHYTPHTHNTASVRLSWTLNRAGGQHAVGKEPVKLSKHATDSYEGRDGQQYIFRNTAYGPFLASRYGNPLLARRNPRPHAAEPIRLDLATAESGGGGDVMAAFHRKQGIVRLVSYRGTHVAGHVGLWNCDHFVQSRDWSKDNHVIAAELWEAPDSYCPPARRPTPPPHLVMLPPDTLAIRLHQLHQPPAPHRTHHSTRHTDARDVTMRRRRRHHHTGRGPN